MADLSVLIRLHKHELDEKRRALVSLYVQMSELERQRLSLEESYETEKRLTAEMEEIPYTFASYAQSVSDRRQELLEAEAELEKHIETAKEDLMETFSEIKKYEMTQEERERIEEEVRRAKEGQLMDDIGLQGFRRKTEQEE